MRHPIRLVTLLAVLTLTMAGVSASPSAHAAGSPSDPLVRGTRVHVMPLTHPGTVPPEKQLRSGAAPQLTYYGGRVVSNVQTVMVLDGSTGFQPYVTNTTAPSLPSFFAGVSNSVYFDWLDSEYNTVTPSPWGSTAKTNQHIGRGTYGGRFTIAPIVASNPDGVVLDADVQNAIAANIINHTLPAPQSDAAGNNNSTYAVFIPQGTKVCSDAAETSCSRVQFCAYHGTIANVPGYGEVYYTLMPDITGMAGGCGTDANDFNNVTSILSHEMIETVTDAEVGVATVYGPPLAWYDGYNAEISDICNGIHSTVAGSDGLTYVIQQQWSNSSNACVPYRDMSVPPTVTTPSLPNGVFGQPYSATLTATGGTPPYIWSLNSGALPDGLTLASSTGLISGTPTAAGPTNFTVQITDHAGLVGTRPLAIGVVPTAPSAPTGVSASAGDAQAVVSWTAPSSTGGAPITSYTVTSDPGGQTCTVASLTCTVTGLTNGTAYTFTVVATNRAGPSPASAASPSVTPVTVPSAPSGVSASAGDAQAVVSWTAPSSNGGAPITHYTVTSHPGGQTCATTGALTCSVTGLTNGTPYTFTVVATNAIGDGAPSDRSNAVTPAAPDSSAPAVTTKSPAANGFTLTSTTAFSWTGTDTGSGVSSYDARFIRSGPTGTQGAWTYPATWQHTAATSVESPALVPGYTYCFAVRARDQAGNTSAWTASRCTAVPLDDRALKASTGWTRGTGTSYFLQTFTAATKQNVTLTSGTVRAIRLGIVATKCSTCGSIAVYLGSTKVGTISLHASATKQKQVLLLPRFATPRSGVVTLKVMSTGKMIRIDGLAVHQG